MLGIPVCLFWLDSNSSSLFIHAYLGSSDIPPLIILSDDAVSKGKNTYQFLKSKLPTTKVHIMFMCTTFGTWLIFIKKSNDVTKNVSLDWYSSMKRKLEQFGCFWLWKSTFHVFDVTCAISTYMKDIKNIFQRLIFW